jgi:hypothetical protein
MPYLDMSLGYWQSSCTLNFDNLAQSSIPESTAAKIATKPVWLENQPNLGIGLHNK